jgi:hypothetical protein
MNRLCAAVFVLLSLGQLSFADSKSLETAKQELRAIKDAGRAPGFVDYVELLNRKDLQLNDVEFYFHLPPFLRSLQEPEISREALAERIAAKRERIKSYVVEVSLNSWQPKRYKLAGDGKKRYQCVWRVPGEGQEFHSRTTSFDGQVVRHHQSGGSNQAHIYPASFLDSPDWSFRSSLMGAPANPIPASMLIDSQAEIGYFDGDLDLVGLLKAKESVLFSGRQEVDGHSCLVAMLHATVVYLDPELEDSVIRRERWNWVRDGNNIKSVNREAFTTFSNFQESGGIRLPTTTTYESTVPRNNFVATVNKLSINGVVEDSLFKDAIPKGVETYQTLDDGTVIQVENE